MVTLFSMPSARQVATTAFILLPLLAGQASAVVPNLCTAGQVGTIPFVSTDTDYKWVSSTCAPNGEVVIAGDNQPLVRVKIEFNNVDTSSGALKFAPSLVLGEGSSITIASPVGAGAIEFGAKAKHPTAAIYFSAGPFEGPFTFTSDATIDTGSVVISALTRTMSVVTFANTFTDASLDIKSFIADGLTAKLVFSGTFEGNSKLTLGSATGAVSEYPLEFAASASFVDSTVNILNTRFANTPVFSAAFTNTNINILGNKFIAGLTLVGTVPSASNKITGGVISFRRNTFTQDDDSLAILDVDVEASINHDATNLYAGGFIRVVTAKTKDSEFVIEGSDQVLDSFSYSQTGCTNTDIKIREVTFTNQVTAPFYFGLIKTTGSKIFVESVKANYISIAGEDSSAIPEPATGADIKIVNNFQLGYFTFNNLHLDASTVTIFGNRFVSTSATSRWQPTGVTSAVSITSTAILIERNSLYALQIIDAADATATEIKLRSNTFAISGFQTDALVLRVSGGAKVDHDASNIYAGGSVRIINTKGNGDVITVDTSASYEEIEIAEVQSANSDIQLRGLTAKTIAVDIAASTHCVVTVESVVTDEFIFGPKILTPRNVLPASYATVNIVNNDNMASFITNDFNLRDSKVTFFRNTFTAASIWSAGIFTRSQVFFAFNTFLSFTANELQQSRGSELKFRNNKFTEIDPTSYSIYVQLTNGGRIDHDETNVYAGGKIELVLSKAENSLFALNGEQTHGDIIFTLVDGQNITLAVRSVTANLVAYNLAGVLQPIILLEGVTATAGHLTLTGDVDKAITNADIKFVDNFAITHFDLVNLNIEDSTLAFNGNEFVTTASTVSVVNAKNTVIAFNDNRILALTLSAESAKNSVFRFRRNAILRRGTVLNALNINLVDGGSIDHDASNKYYGGVVTVASINTNDNVFALDGIQSHGVFTYSETDSVASVVTLRSFTTSALTVTIANARNANVLIESTTSEGDLTLKGGLGRSTAGSTIKVIGNDADVLHTVDFNLADSSLTFANNIIMSTTEHATWALASITRTCVTYESNSFQYGLLMADAAVNEGSTVQFRNNNFWQTDKDVVAFNIKITADGRIDHDESNRYAGGIVSVDSSYSKNSVFVLDSKRSKGAVTYLESGTGTNAYVAFNGFKTASLDVNLGASVSSSALISNVIVDGTFATRMARATGSYIAVQDSTLKGDITLAGSLKANSQYLVRNVKSVSTVNFAATTDCLVDKPCRVEFDGNALSSVDAGSSLEITGSVGDNTLLSIVGNRLGRSATATAINFASASALTGSASLVIARNLAPRWSEIDRAISFASILTFTGSADVWGNVFVAGGIRLRIGATPTVVNVVKNRATFFLVYGADVSGGRVSACNVLSATDKATTILGAGFENKMCSADVTLTVCGADSNMTLAVTDAAFTGCSGALVLRNAPRNAAGCSLTQVTDAPTMAIAKPAASATAAPVAPIAAPLDVDLSVAGAVSSPVAAADVSDRFTQGASSASVAASVAVVAMVGAMMAL